MAAPSPTARGTPAGIKMDDGHSTLITIGSLTTISFWEKTVKPPGVDGGDKIDTTTMHNVTYRTFEPRALITLTECTTSAAWDPNLYNQLVQHVNRNTTITVRFPDGSTCAFYGFVKSAEPGEHSEGEMPMIDVTIEPTNWDPANRVEAGPVLTSVSGT